jgi:hypothetical protein
VGAPLGQRGLTRGGAADRGMDAREDAFTPADVVRPACAR